MDSSRASPAGSFVWGFFQWFYTAKDNCGFSQFPTFGLQAKKQTFYFDFSLTYVGTGMICSHAVNLSLLLGAVVSYGLMWPLIHQRKGDWFPADIPESSMKSLTGYKAFIPIALLLGDGLYNFVKILGITFINIHNRRLNQNSTHPNSTAVNPTQDEVFVSQSLPFWIAALGYLIFAAVSVIAIPFIFPDLKWYLVVMAYVVTPGLAFCNAYGAGLTDMNMSSLRSMLIESFFYFGKFQVN